MCIFPSAFAENPDSESRNPGLRERKGLGAEKGDENGMENPALFEEEEKTERLDTCPDSESRNSAFLGLPGSPVLWTGEKDGETKVLGGT